MIFIRLKLALYQIDVMSDCGLSMRALRSVAFFCTDSLMFICQIDTLNDTSFTEFHLSRRVFSFICYFKVKHLF